MVASLSQFLFCPTKKSPSLLIFLMGSTLSGWKSLWNGKRLCSKDKSNYEANLVTFRAVKPVKVVDKLLESWTGHCNNQLKHAIMRLINNQTMCLQHNKNNLELIV